MYCAFVGVYEKQYFDSVFSHWSYFFSLFFFHRHQQLKNHSGSGGVEVLRFLFFGGGGLDGLFDFFLEVTCDSNSGCHSGGVGLIWLVSELMGLCCFVSVVPRRRF